MEVFLSYNYLVEVFNPEELKKLFRPANDSSGEDNGQVTIIGGSHLFHGAPLLSVAVASRVVDMVFFTSPEPSVGRIAGEMKSKLLSFIWTPWEETEEYIKKSDAILIGPGFMRFRNEGKQTEECDEECRKTKEITKELLEKFPNKKWVIDAGSLQVMNPSSIPENSIVTPNKKEFQILFGDLSPREAAKKYKCVIIAKGPVSYVYDAKKQTEIKGGNAGLTKGGTGDVLAGLTAALLAKNDPFLSACAASYIVKKAADELASKVGTFYNADDLADSVPETLNKYL